MTRDMIEKFMLALKSVLEARRYNPSLIFNFDETFLSPGDIRIKFVCRADGPRPIKKIVKLGKHITLALCVSADGSHLKTLCILPLVNLPDFKSMNAGELEEKFMYSGQPAGWENAEIFQLWIEQCFVPTVERIRQQFGTGESPALLIVDGHGSRDNPDIEKLLKQHDIDMLVIPAHSSHILQPLDLTVTGIFKHELGKLFRPNFDESLESQRIRLLRAADLALYSAFRSDHVRNGFSRAGIHPFNIAAPLTSPCLVDAAVEKPVEVPKKRRRRETISGKIFGAVASSTALSSVNPSASASSSPNPNVASSSLVVPTVCSDKSDQTK